MKGELIEILLVEDNPGDVRLTQEAFKESKIYNRIHVVYDGVEALAFLHRLTANKPFGTTTLCR